MTEFYNPYTKMYDIRLSRLLDIDSTKTAELKKTMESLSPQKIALRRLEVKARQAITIPDRADLIEEDKMRKKTAKAFTTNQRLEALDEAIKLEDLDNKNYISHQQANLLRQAEESALVKDEQERVWQHSNAEALNRSRFLLTDITRNQIDRDALKSHQTQVRLATDHMKDVELRQAIERSRIMAEAAQRENLLMRSSLLKASKLTAYPY